MRRFNITSSIGFFLCLLTFLSSAYGVGEYGSVGSDTLNFIHSTLKLKTGLNGNTTILDEDDKKIKVFDVDEIHENLQQHVKDLKTATGEHNVVVAGLTLLIKLDDRYEAFFQILTDDKGAPMAFVSGSTPRKFSNKKYNFVCSSEDYEPMDLLRSFGNRLTQIKEPSLQFNEISSCYKLWEKNLIDPLATARTEVGNMLQQQFSSVLDLNKAIQPTLQKACKDSNESFGSSTDSEQYFLQHLKKKTTNLIESSVRPRLIDECGKLRGSYDTQKIDFFKNTLFKTNNIDTLISRA